MSGPRRRTFGPLFYWTLALGAIVAGFSIVSRLQSTIADRREMQSDIERLRSRDLMVREQAASQLEWRDRDVCMRIMVEATRDSWSTTRFLACRSLVKLGADPSVVVPVLAAGAADQEDMVRVETAHTLGTIAGLALVANRSYSEARAVSAAALRGESLRMLGRLLNDRSSVVRGAAAAALAAFRIDPVATAGLVRASNDDDPLVRFNAARSLLEINGPNDPTATRTLLALVADPDAGPIRGSALEALKQSRSEVQDQASAALIGLLSHDDPAVVAEAIACIPHTGARARAAVPRLESLLDADEVHVRAAAGMAILTIEGHTSARAVAILVRMIADSTLLPNTRETAVALLMEADPDALVKATPALVGQLGDVSSTVRCNAVNLLSMFIDRTRAEMPASSDAK